MKKDIGHHSNKLNKKIIQESHKEAPQIETEAIWQKDLQRQPSPYEEKKLGKLARRHDELHALKDKEEENQKMKHRTPRLRKRAHDSKNT